MLVTSLSEQVMLNLKCLTDCGLEMNYLVFNGRVKAQPSSICFYLPCCVAISNQHTQMPGKIIDDFRNKLVVNMSLFNYPIDYHHCGIAALFQFKLFSHPVHIPPMVAHLKNARIKWTESMVLKFDQGSVLETAPGNFKIWSEPPTIEFLGFETEFQSKEASLYWYLIILRRLLHSPEQALKQLIELENCITKGPLAGKQSPEDHNTCFQTIQMITCSLQEPVQDSKPYEMHFPASSLGMENIEKPTKLKKLKNWINWKIKKLINLKNLNCDKKNTDYNFFLRNLVRFRFYKVKIKILKLV